jgi:hypothetical protein
MIKLTKLLTECFYNGQWEAFYKEFPQYVSLIKNDPMVLKDGFWQSDAKEIQSASDKDIYTKLGYMGGTYCGSAPDDFTYKGVSKFFEQLVKKKEITEDTKNKILLLAKEYFDNYPTNVDNANKRSEVGWWYRDYKSDIRNWGEERALARLERNIERAKKESGVTSNFVRKYNITLDDVLNYKEND